MSAEDTPRRTPDTDDGKALCQWERTVEGSLIARWRRGHLVGNRTQLCEAPVRNSVTDRRHAPGVRQRRVSERLGAAAMIVAMYLVIGFAVFSVFWGTAATMV